MKKETARERFLRLAQKATGFAGERMTEDDAGVHTRRALRKAAPVVATLATLAAAGGFSMTGILEVLAGLIGPAVLTTGATEWLKDLLRGLRFRLANGVDDLPKPAKRLIALALAYALAAVAGVDVVDLLGALGDAGVVDDGTLIALLSMGVTWVLGRLRGKGGEAQR